MNEMDHKNANKSYKEAVKAIEFQVKITEYTAYRRWCQDNGYNSPVCSARFKNAVLRMYPDARYNRPRNGSQKRVTVIEGISLQDGVSLTDWTTHFTRISYL